MALNPRKHATIRDLFMHDGIMKVRFKEEFNAENFIDFNSLRFVDICPTKDFLDISTGNT